MPKTTQTIEVFVDPYEDVVARFIKQDQQRLQDLRIFNSLQETEPHNLERTGRGIMDEVKRSGIRQSSEMTAMMYVVDEKTGKFTISPNLAAMAKKYQYKLYVRTSDKNGNPLTIGPFHHRSSVYGRSGEMLKPNKLKSVAEASHKLMTAKSKRP